MKRTDETSVTRSFTIFLQYPFGYYSQVCVMTIFMMIMIILFIIAVKIIIISNMMRIRICGINSYFQS